MDGVVLAAVGIGGSVLAWTLNAHYTRIVGLLDDTAKELTKVAQALAQVQGAHGARLDALEREL